MGAVSLDRPCKVTDARQNARGYGVVQVGGKPVYAHRLAFFEAHGYYPPVVRHRCDNPPCVEPTHLEAGTQADNLQDMFDRGRARRAQGEAVSTAKLTWESVRAIRAALATGSTPAEQARIHGVTHKTIRKIRDRKTWIE